MSVATTAVPSPAAPGVVLPLVLPLAPTRDPDGRPTLRLLPAPPCEPPYDDELVAPAAPRALAPAAAPAARGGITLRLVARGGASPLLRDDDDDPARRTPLSQLPPARPFARALVQRLLEVLAGLRPLTQLRRDTSFELLEELEQALAGRPRATGARPTPRDVRSVHVQVREDGVAEVCATVRRGGRACALALRLEGVEGAWQCTELVGV